MVPPGLNATALTNVPFTSCAVSKERVARSHSSRSLLPTASTLPECWNAMLFTGPLAARTGGGSVHNRTTPSAPPVTRRFALSQTSDVMMPGSGSVPISLPVARFQRCTASSLLPASTVVPFGLNATAFTQSVAPLSGASRIGRTGSVTFHRHTSSSRLPTARVSPFGLKATLRTVFAGPASGAPSPTGPRGSATFQRRTILPAYPAAKIPPSGLNATASAAPAAWDSVASGRAWLGSDIFHRRIAPSALPAASTVLLGLNATEYTVFFGPPSGPPTAKGCCGLLTFHTWTVSAAPAAATNCPFGLNATAYSGLPGSFFSAGPSENGRPGVATFHSRSVPSLAATARVR